MTKFIEVKFEKGQVERYHLSGITQDEFIDSFLIEREGVKRTVKDITAEEFKSHPNSNKAVFLQFEGGRIMVVHYIVKHTSWLARWKWNKVVKKHQAQMKTSMIIVRD